MRTNDAERTRVHTPEEWAAIAEQTARQAKQDFNARRGSPQNLPRHAIVYPLFVIAVALTALFLPELYRHYVIQPEMDFQRPQEIWLRAHPVASFFYTAFVLAAAAGGVWHRLKGSRRATQEEIERLRVK